MAGQFGEWRPRLLPSGLGLLSTAAVSPQISELALEVAVIYYGGHLVISNQMSSGELIAFFIYVLELAECLEVFAFCSSPPV